MDVGMALPTMAQGYGPETTAEWCAVIDDGPFSSVSCGERITFTNPEMLVTCSAAAVLTHRVRVFVNLAVTPLHPPALLAKALMLWDPRRAARRAFTDAGRAEAPRLVSGCFFCLGTGDDAVNLAGFTHGGRGGRIDWLRWAQAVSTVGRRSSGSKPEGSSTTASTRPT